MQQVCVKYINIMIENWKDLRTFSGAGVILEPFENQ